MSREKTLEVGRKYKFSVVMAVYNVEDYLEEAVASLVDQTIGFENIQVILVNDGSTDNSLLVAEQLAEEYPDNITVVTQENSGSAVARNNGIKLAEGELINFLDPDDYFGAAAFKRVWETYEKNPDIKIYKAIVQRFEGVKGPHFLNYVLKEKRIVNIDNPDEFGTIFQQSAPAFFKYDVFDENPFPVGFATAEDSYGINRIMMRERKFMAMPDVRYWYRIRKDSQVQTSMDKPEKYTPHINQFILEPIEAYFKQHDGSIHPWLQHVYLYEISWIIKMREVPSPLEEDADFSDYMEALYQAIQFIDDEYIERSSKWLNFEQRHALIHFKHNHKLPNPDLNDFYDLTVGKKDISAMGTNGKAVTRLSRLRSAVKGFTATDAGIRMNGLITGVLPWNELHFYVQDNRGNKIPLIQQTSKHFEIKFIGKTIYKPFVYFVEIPSEFVQNANYIQIMAELRGKKQPINLKLGGNTVRLASENEYAWIQIKDKMIRYSERSKKILSVRSSVLQAAKWEIKYILNYRKYKKARKDKGMTFKLPNIFKLGAWRTIATISKLCKKQKINLFMDRVDKADDNAEVLYKYVSSNYTHKNYFILDKRSVDYPRLKKLGYNLVGFRSVKHLFLLMLADNMISSHADIEMTMPFRYKYLRSLNDKQTANFIFLQHGIIKGNLSSWLRKSNQDPRMMVVSTEKEYESIVDPDSGYGLLPEDVKMVGLPRYDRLKRNKADEKYITIMPTWRQDVVVGKQQNGLRPYTWWFIYTDYFKKWNEVLSNQELKQAVARAGYKLKFVPHPNIRIQVEDFDLDGVEIVGENERYVDIIRESAAVITDFSSIFFDFAYSGKSVFYYHFDEGNFGDKSNEHFDYEIDGLGAVAYDFDQLLNNVLQSAAEGFERSEEYDNRAKITFPFIDQNNSERTWGAIESL